MWTTGERVIWSSGPTYTQHYEWYNFPDNNKEIEMYLYTMKTWKQGDLRRAVKDGVASMKQLEPKKSP
jgi:hypothetical protein